MKSMIHRFQGWAILAIATCLLGTVYAQGTETTVDSNLTLSPVGRYVSVDGNTALFQEHYWMPEGGDGGMSFSYVANNADMGKLTIKGSGMVVNNNYDLDLTYEPTDSIFYLKIGGSNFRKYYDNVGGYYRNTAYALSYDDMKMDISKLYVELGIVAEDFPTIVLGFDMLRRNGTKSTLENASAPSGKNILPSTKEIDEEIYTFSIDVKHTIGGVNIEDNLRYTIFDGAVYRWDSTGSSTHTVPETWDEDVWNNTLLLDSWLTDNFLLSFGYMYETMDGESWFHVIQSPFLGVNHAKDFEADVHDIGTDAHVLSLSGLWLPCPDVTVLMGVQGQMSDTDVDAEFIIKEENDSDPDNGFAPIEDVLAETSTEMKGLREDLELRYSGLPSTTIYVKGIWEQQSWNKSETELIDGELPLGLDRETESDTMRQTYRIGFTTNPASSMNLTAYYQKKMKYNDYDHVRDMEGGEPASGYSAFITRQEFDSDEVSTKLTVQNATWLRTTYRYQLLSSEIYEENNYEGSSVPGGRANSNEYLQQVYTFNATAIPSDDWLVSLSVAFRETESRSPATNSPYIDTYTGDVWTLYGHTTYQVNDATSANLHFLVEKADNDQDSSLAAGGWPTVSSYERQSVGVALNHDFSDTVSASLGYDFINYNDDTAADYGEYQAHVITAGLNLLF